VDVLIPVCRTHAAVLAEISFKTFIQHYFKRQIRKYNAADIEGLADELNITNWDDLVFNSDIINDVYSNFLLMLLKNTYLPRLLQFDQMINHS
jgi:hypothetical protein